jgi:hypothetical protein
LVARGTLGCGWPSELELVGTVEAGGAALRAQEGWVDGVRAGLCLC